MARDFQQQIHAMQVYIGFNVKRSSSPSLPGSHKKPQKRVRSMLSHELRRSAQVSSASVSSALVSSASVVVVLKNLERCDLCKTYAEGDAMVYDSLDGNSHIFCSSECLQHSLLVWSSG